MAYEELFASIDAVNAARIRYDTWGHLDAEPGTEHEGAFLFIHGQHGDMVVVESEFPTFGEGPEYFEHRADFIWSKVKDKGPCSEVGIYRFIGKYRLCKNGNGRFVGKIERVDCPLLQHSSSAKRR